MKRCFFFLACALFNLAAAAQIDTLAYRATANTIQKKYAPDKRSVYFDVRFKGDSVFVESTSEQAVSAFGNSFAANEKAKLILSVLPSKQLKDQIYGVTTISVANNRSKPFHGAELMTQTLLGTPIQILKKQGGFYLVKSPDGYLAWTDGGSIALMNENKFKEWQAAKKIIYVNDYGHALVKADPTAARISDLVAGNVLRFLATEGSFTKVAFPDGREAYIPTNQTADYSAWLKRPIPSTEAILKTAQTLIGVPYLWGGTSIKGVDCSGFTKTAYFLNGVIIPRDASQQALVGEKLDVTENDSVSVEKCLKNLKPGDLMFFSAAKRRGVNGGRISHTAIYMGNGEFIQSAGMVKISSILPTATNYDEYQTKTLVGARRILTQINQPEITKVEKHDWYFSKK
ncbi:MAG: SH3 domain-containing C40 family peptidase [Pedobacter sp.]|uniref:C40 family peptidase n=1 Tax=Pedobacter sp. TaxID=1411316 RepID=UPI0028096D24|nr:SH3 domain-containing C40 family peptidase [Pedobacter sp.]MDQ8005517.1 SH3 domain-containing C40 family peptidase [Pedobacter sp.]